MHFILFTFSFSLLYRSCREIKTYPLSPNPIFLFILLNLFLYYTQCFSLSPSLCFLFSLLHSLFLHFSILFTRSRSLPYSHLSNLNTLFLTHVISVNFSQCTSTKNIDDQYQWRLIKIVQVPVSSQSLSFTQLMPGLSHHPYPSPPHSLHFYGPCQCLRNTLTAQTWQQQRWGEPTVESVESVEQLKPLKHSSSCIESSGSLALAVWYLNASPCWRSLNCQFINDFEVFFDFWFMPMKLQQMSQHSTVLGYRV